LTSVQVPAGTSLTELVKIAYSKAFRLFRPAFGKVDDLASRRYRVGRAAPHKGVKGIDNIRKLGGKYENMADVLEDNIRKVKALKGTSEAKGVAVVYKDGEYIIMPRIAATMALNAGNITEDQVTFYPTKAMAMSRIQQLTGIGAPVAMLPSAPGEMYV